MADVGAAQPGGGGGGGGSKATMVTILSDLDALKTRLNATPDLKDPKATQGIRNQIKNDVKSVVGAEMDTLAKMKKQNDPKLADAAQAAFGRLYGLSSAMGAFSTGGMDHGSWTPAQGGANPAADLKDAQKVIDNAIKDLKNNYLPQQKKAAWGG